MTTAASVNPGPPPNSTVPNPSSAAATSSNPATAATQNTANFNSFLKLLTTQLANQDPLNPIDATQFTSQLAQFSSVEQQVQTNSNLKDLISAQNAGQAMTSVSMLGKLAEVQGNVATLQGGSAEWDYKLSNAAASTTINILNSDGQTVRTMTGPTTSGAHQLVWDGTANDGTQLPDGQYKAQVTAIDSSGKAVSGTIDAFNLITGVSFSSGVPMLDTPNGQVALSDVLSVRQPAPAKQAASSQ
jgi:flagellar basal-body rod modification protein FlgD